MSNLIQNLSMRYQNNSFAPGWQIRACCLVFNCDPVSIHIKHTTSVGIIKKGGKA